MKEWYKVTGIDEQGQERDCGFYPSLELAQECTARAKELETFAKWEFTYSPMDLGEVTEELEQLR